MSTTVRRVVLAGIALVLVAVGVGVYYHGGSEKHPASQSREYATTRQVPMPDIEENTAQLRTLKAKAGIETCRPGRGHSQLPALSLACLGGGPAVDLSRLQGPVLLSFWQAGCTQCRREMPALQSFSDRYGKQVPVLGVDFLDQYPASAIAMMHRYGGRYPSVADPNGALLKTSPFSKIRGYPTLFFIDKQGSVSYVHPGPVTSESDLVDLVHEHLGVDL